MTTKVTIKKAREEQFQVEVGLTQTVAELKDKIKESKGYATESLNLIHSGKALKDSQVFETIGIKENDFIVLLVSKAKREGPSPTDTPTAIEPVESSSQTPSLPPGPSLKGKEVIRDREPTINGIVPSELPINNRPHWNGLSPEASQTVYQSHASAGSSSPPWQPHASTSSSIPPWQPPVQPGSSKQNNNLISTGAQGDGTLGNMGDMASMKEMIRTNPSMRQKVIEMATQQNPAFGQELRRNPAMVDSLIDMASAQVDRDRPNLQTDLLTAEEREAVKRLMDLGFKEKQVVEAYLVSDKDEELAVNYLLNSDAEGHEEPIAQKDPALAQKFKENPASFERDSQQHTFTMTFEEHKAILRMEDLGFTKEKALEAYIVCDKNEEHAINYLISNPEEESGFRLVPAGSPELPSYATIEEVPDEADTVEPATSTTSASLPGLQSGAIERLVALGFTEKQATHAYDISDEDEALAKNYLLAAHRNSNGGLDNPVDPRPVTSQLSSPPPTSTASEVHGDAHPVANLQTQKRDSPTQPVTFHQALPYIALLIAGFSSWPAFLVLLISVILSWAAVAALAKLPEQGTKVDTVSDIVNTDKLEHFHFQTITYWVAAEHALQHVRSKIAEVSEVFDRWNIQECEYVVRAGFDESLIKSGVGYLEQIHVFVFAKVDANSLLLSELGRLFSPFSSILFTDSSSYHLPVFKDDGSVWEFDELIYFTASKFADGGSSAKTPLAVISFCQPSNLADSPTDFSPGNSGSGEGEKNKMRRSEKGKRGGGEEDEDDVGDRDDKDPDDNPEEPSGDQGGTIAEPPEISFEIGSEICLVQDEQNPFQTLTVHGSLTIKTTPLAQSPPQFSKRRVEFTQLKFDTLPSTTDTTYKQFHLMVVVNSQQENAQVKDVRPKRTPDSNGEAMDLLSTKTSEELGVTVSPHGLGWLEIAAMRRKKVHAVTKRERYNSGITEHSSDGIVRWGFNIDDVNFQKRGIDIQENNLPSVCFEFLGGFDVPAPPPESMDVVIASLWSMAITSKPESTWIRKLLRLFGSPENTQTTPYSNLLQIVALKTVPSKLPPRSHYKAKMKVRSGASDPPEVKRPVADSISVTPAVVDDLQKLSTFNLPTIAKFKLSDNCIQTLENLGCDRKSP